VPFWSTRILILDEATSSIDTHGSAGAAAIARLLKGRTSFVIARLKGIRCWSFSRQIVSRAHSELIAQQEFATLRSIRRSCSGDNQDKSMMAILFSRCADAGIDDKMPSGFFSIGRASLNQGMCEGASTCPLINKRVVMNVTPM